MRTQLRRFAVLLGLVTSVSAQLALPASADSTAALILSLKCPNDYTLNVWKRYRSGELLYRGTGLLGNLSVDKGTIEATGAAQVYKFKHGGYTYQVIKGTKDHQGQGTVEVFKNGRSVLSQTCIYES